MQINRVKYKDLEEIPENERRSFLIDFIREHIAEVLGLTFPEEINIRQRLFDLGIDSLMAVELKNKFSISFERPLRATLLFDYPTVEVLADYLINEVLNLEFSKQSEDLQKLPDNIRTDPENDQEKLTYDETRDLLARELAAITEDKHK